MKSIKSKINSVGKGELSSEDLYKLRKTLTALNPEDDINNILAKIPNKSTTYPSKDSNVNEASALSNAKQVNLIGFTNELQYTKNQSINEFSSLISTKTDSEIRQILPQKLNEYQQRVQLIIDKSDQQYNTYIQQLSSSKEKNNELQVQITKMRNEENKLAEQYSESERSIRKLNLKFELFSKLKPIFEVLIREFETDTDDEEKRKNIPKEIIRDIKLRRAEEINCAEEMEAKNAKIKKLVEETKQINYEYRQSIEELSKQLSQIEKENLSKIEQYQDKISDLKYELSSNSDYKNQNEKLHNMLIQIFNLLFPKLNLERDLITNCPGLELESSDYKPRTFDEEEVIRYITLMIKNAKESTSGVLLREAVAYSNMMLRDVIKDKVNQNYNPFFIFKEIEKLIKAKEIEKENLNKIILKYQEEATKDTDVITNLEKEIQKQDHQYQVVMNKVNQMFKERIETAKNDKKKKVFAATMGSKFHHSNTQKNQLQFSRSSSHSSEKSEHNIKGTTKENSKSEIHHNILDPNRKLIIPFLEEDTSARANYTYKNNYFNKNQFYKYQTKLPAETDGARVLIDHANRLMLYKGKSHPKQPAKSAMDRLKKKMSKLEQIKNRKLNPFTEDNMSHKLMNQLENIITSINNSDNK